MIFFLFSFKIFCIMSNEIIQPRVLKGFRDSLPEAEILRADLIETITKTYRSFGFVPIDTPVLEYTEILLRKSEGETEKQVFRFTDNGGRDVAMRFDLTVPFARFTAEHKSEIYFPFKRYHIAKVWRGEKPQAGRYREFYQCDIDTVGSDCAASDFEILSAIKATLEAIGIQKFKIHINHRGVFNRFLGVLGVLEKSEEILRCVDKIAKVGEAEVKTELLDLTGGEEKANSILTYIKGGEDFDSTLSLIEKMAGGEADDTKRLREIRAMFDAAGIEGTFILNPSITRGLDYYTGIVFETFLDELPSIGSVCSGGRYDNLAGLYTKEKISGVGGSIGLDRLIAALSQLGLTQKKGSYLDAEIFCASSENLPAMQKAAASLRALGVNVEIFPEPKKMSQQYALCDAKKIPWGIFVSENSALSLKNLATRDQNENLSAEDVAKTIKENA